MGPTFDVYSGTRDLIDIPGTRLSSPTPVALVSGVGGEVLPPCGRLLEQQPEKLSLCVPNVHKA